MDSFCSTAAALGTPTSRLAPVDPNSATIISNFVGSVNVHPDFGTDPSYGIPYVVVNGSQSLVNVNLNAYTSESDPGPMPVPANAPVEGGSSSSGDRHVLVLDNQNCFLYELYNSFAGIPDGSWNGGFDLPAGIYLGNEQRPYTWTSADAAGLPIFPGLVRYDEVASGKIQHAFRFTLPRTSAAFTPPASHDAATSSDPTAPPMGMRIRLKSSYDISSFDASMQVILTAMQKYGLILADNGSALYVTGASDSRWRSGPGEFEDRARLGLRSRSDEPGLHQRFRAHWSRTNDQQFHGEPGYCVIGGKCCNALLVYGQRNLQHRVRPELERFAGPASS